VSVLGAVSVKLHATPKAVNIARLLVKSALESWGLDELRDDALLIVSELVTNAVMVGPGPVRDPDGLTLVAVQVRVQDSTLVIEVWDRHRKLPMPRTAGDDAESGRGLLLVEAFSSRWGVWEPESGGKVVYADLNIDKPPVVSLEGELVKLPDEVLAAHVAGDSEPHVMADTALMLRCMNGFALL